MVELRIRTILLIAAGSLLLGFIAGSGFRAIQNRGKFEALATQLRDQEARNRELENLNSEHLESIRIITAELSDARAELGRVSADVDGIGTGLSRDIESVSDNIERIQQIREAIKEYQNSTNSSVGPGSP